MVRITVIWLSVKYQKFFSFQNVTYAHPPHDVNVPFTSSHIKGIKVVIRTEFINLFILPEAEFNSFFKEIILVIRNFCIAMSEIELVFQRAERQCSGSLFSMLLFKKLYLMQIFNQYLSVKRMIHVQMYVCMDTNIAAWIELSLRRCKRCHEHSMINFISMRDCLIPLICIYIPERVRA